MTHWSFEDYQRPTKDGPDAKLVNEVLEWTLGLPKKAQAKIDTLIITLQSCPGVWPPQYVSDCGYADIWEIRAGSSGVQYRPLGFYGPRRKTFTIVIGTIEKGGRIPAGDGNSAIEKVPSTKRLADLQT